MSSSPPETAKRCPSWEKHTQRRWLEVVEECAAESLSRSHIPLLDLHGVAGGSGYRSQRQSVGGKRHAPHAVLALLAHPCPSSVFRSCTSQSLTVWALAPGRQDCAVWGKTRLI